MSRNTKYMIGFIVLVALLTPLGLIAEGPAWGEWSNEEIRSMLGFVPASIENAKPLVEAIIPDYAIEGMGDLASTWLSALLGMGLVFAILFGMKRSVSRER